MDHRNRNTAVMLVIAGMYLLLGHMFGFFTVSAFIVIWLGVYKIREEGNAKTGYILLGVGVLILINSHLSIIVAITLISLGIFFIQSKRAQKDAIHTQRQSLLESMHYDTEPWELKNLSLWVLIGEVNMDFSLAISESSETTLVLQGVIGDVDMIIPDDMGVSVHASVLLGQIDVGQERETGILNRISWTSPNYETSEHKVKLVISYIVGDIDIKIV